MLWDQALLVSPTEVVSAPSHSKTSEHQSVERVTTPLLVGDECQSHLRTPLLTDWVNSAQISLYLRPRGTLRVLEDCFLSLDKLFEIFPFTSALS